MPATQESLAQELRDRLATAARGGPESSRERHVARGKLLPRDRVARVLDEGSPFLDHVAVVSPTLDVLELLSGKTHRARLTGLDPTVAATARAVIGPDHSQAT